MGNWMKLLSLRSLTGFNIRFLWISSFITHQSAYCCSIHLLNFLVLIGVEALEPWGPQEFTYDCWTFIVFKFGFEIRCGYPMIEYRDTFHKVVSRQDNVMRLLVTGLWKNLSLKWLLYYYTLWNGWPVLCVVETLATWQCLQKENYCRAN